MALGVVEGIVVVVIAVAEGWWISELKEDIGAYEQTIKTQAQQLQGCVSKQSREREYERVADDGASKLSKESREAIRSLEFNLVNDSEIRGATNCDGTIDPAGVEDLQRINEAITSINNSIGSHTTRPLQFEGSGSDKNTD